MNQNPIRRRVRAACLTALLAAAVLAPPSVAQDGQPPRQEGAAARPAQQVTGRDVLIDFSTVKQAHERVRETMVRAIDETGIQAAQARVEELVLADEPDRYALLDAVHQLQDAYRAFLERQASIVDSVDRGQEQIQGQIEGVNLKMASLIESGGIDHRAQIERAEASLGRLARVIREREDAGLNTVDLRSEFASLLQLREVLSSLEGVGTSRDEALRTAAQVKDILDGFVWDLRHLEQQLAVAGPVLESEITLLDFVGYALEAEILLEETKGMTGKLGESSEALASWIGQIGKSRESLASSIGRTRAGRSVRPMPGSPGLEAAIAGYAREAGYRPPAGSEGGAADAVAQQQSTETPTNQNGDAQ